MFHWLPSINSNMTILITGGAGFIGCNFAKLWLSQESEPIINLDKLTYAGRVENFADEKDNANYEFIKGDMGDSELVDKLLKEKTPRAIINFAAESHVDRSITGGDDFIQSNIIASYNLLKSAYEYWLSLDDNAKENFRFVQISTDEVYGSLNFDEPAFTETSPQAPSSIYSASKAASDNLAHAYFKTYGLPVIITHSSNNYGSFQFPEKLIPVMILKALHNEPLPVYGNGKNIRDWIHVEDNCQAIKTVLQKGKAGETYNIGGENETDNLSLVKSLCDILDQKRPRQDGKSYAEQISFVTDRLGHDLRYAINIDKIKKELGWQPQKDLTQGLTSTIEWYLAHEDSYNRC